MIYVLIGIVINCVCADDAMAELTAKQKKMGCRCRKAAVIMRLCVSATHPQVPTAHTPHMALALSCADTKHIFKGSHFTKKVWGFGIQEVGHLTLQEILAT